MDKSVESDLPPAYNTLMALPEESKISAVVNDTEPLISNSFENKNARVVFTQKVLSIFLLQIVLMGILFAIFVYFDYWYDVSYNFIWGTALVYLVTIIVMLCVDRLKNRMIYNYLILVYYPLLSAFVIIMLPALCDYHTVWQRKLRPTILCTWVSYILVTFTMLLYSVFSYDCKHEFKLLDKFIITVVAFFVCLSNTIPLYAEFRDLEPILLIFFTLILYMYYMYVLYDIDAMTSSDYRTDLTPADYVTGAVNLQIDLLFIAKDFIKRKWSRKQNTLGSDNERLDEIIQHFNHRGVVGTEEVNTSVN